MTLDAAIKLLKPHKRTLGKYDRSWTLDWTYLCNHARPILEEKMDAEIISYFPIPGKPKQPSIGDVIDMLTAAKARQEVLVLPLEYARDLKTSVSILTSIQGYQSPSESTSKKYFPRHLGILKAAEAWCTLGWRRLRWRRAQQQ